MKLFKRDRAKKRLKDLLQGEEPPTFPKSAMKLMRLLRDPETEMSVIGEALEWDPRLVLRVLKTVNSAAYGTARKIDNISHAVSMMGRTQLEQIVLGVVVKDNLPRASTPGFDAQRFWQTAFFRATIGRAIANRLHPSLQAQSFTGGLLQDMAVPLLAHARPDEYGAILREWHGSGEAQLHKLEKEVLGFGHDEVGAHLSVEWELPETLSTIIGNHHSHDLGDDELPPAMRLVSIHRETERDLGLEALLEEARNYSLDPDWIMGAVETSDAQATELAKSLL